MEGIHRVIKNNDQAYKRPSIFSGLRGNWGLSSKVCKFFC